MRCPRLDELPTPSEKKIGWPWTEQTNPLPDKMPDGSDWPRISIVTPSYNQGQFIEETIRSVLLQGYPNFEYIIIDGGSTDNSVEIIKKYDQFLSYWVSEPDNGQSSAINRGMNRASGVWFNWLNSDDILLPNAMFTLAEIVLLDSEIQWISGGRLLISKIGSYVDHYLPWRTNPMIVELDYPALFPQDATFFRLDWVRSQGIQITEELHNVMDTVLYFQLMELERPLLTTAVFSAMRLHEDQKGGRLEKLQKEVREAVEPLWQCRPLFTRILFRLIHLRWGVGLVTRLCLRVALQYGLIPNMTKWKIAIFSTNSFQWELISLKGNMFIN
jgi:glycosyltransferase involved in cell wall biosynthesis